MESYSVYKLGELAGEQRSLLRDRLCIIHRVVSNCICAPLVLCIYYYYYLFLCFPMKLSLSQPMSFTFFFFFFPPFSFPSHWGGEE